MLVSACGGGSTSTPDKIAQSTLVASALSSNLPVNGSTTLSTTGGSGDGAVSYTVTSGSCTITSGTTLNAPSTAGTCSVTAAKAANATYLAATSAAITVTVTAIPSTTFATFDETTAPGLTAFGGDTGTIVTDPTGGTNKVLKVDKPANSESWAGVTISKCSYPSDSLAVIPLTSTNKTMSLRVYSTAPNKVLRLKLENATNGAINVEMDATVTAANTWQTLTFDITSPAMNGTSPTRTWTASDVLNKASVFADFGNTTAATMYVDDLKFIGVSGVSQTCMSPPVAALPVTFDNSAVSYTLTDFGGNTSALEASPPTGGTGTAVKVTKGVAGTASEVWAGTTVITGTIPFTSSAKSMSVRVWAPAAGKTVKLKAEHLTNQGISVETDVLTTVAAGWQTLTFDFGAPSTGSGVDLAQTYSKVSIFFDFGVGGTGQIYYFDTLTFLSP